MCMSEEEKRRYSAYSKYINEHYMSNHTVLRVAIFVTSIVFIVTGIVSIGCWGRMLALTWDDRGDPITNSAGIWGGAVALIPGIFGILAVIKKSYGLLGGQMWSTVGSIGGAFSQYIRLAYVAWDKCRRDGTIPACRPADTVADLALVCFILGLIMSVASLVVIIYYSYISCKGSKECSNSTAEANNDGMQQA